jgi:cytohesin
MRLILRAGSLATLIAVLSLNGCSPAFRLASDAANGDVAAVKADLAKTPVDAPSFLFDGDTALGVAAHHGRFQVVKVLLAAGAKVDAGSGGATPLMDAASGSAAGGDYPGVVAALISAGADPNAKDEGGRTPLAFAVIVGRNPAVVPILAKAGAQVNAIEVGGKTPLSWAAWNGDVQ